MADRRELVSRSVALQIITDGEAGCGRGACSFYDQTYARCIVGGYDEFEDVSDGSRSTACLALKEVADG